MERVKFSIKVFDNFLEIIPEDGMKDNSIYEIRLKDLKEFKGSKRLEPTTVKVCTKLTPAYTTINAVQSLVESCSVSDETILYHIREASKYADYIKFNKNIKFNDYKLDKENEKFQTEQFVKYQAAYECMLRFYMDKASESGIKGALGDIQFDSNAKLPDISALLKTLKAEVEKWSLALQGHTEIRAGIQTGVKSSSTESYRATTKGSQSPEYSRRTYI